MFSLQDIEMYRAWRWLLENQWSHFGQRNPSLIVIKTQSDVICIPHVIKILHWPHSQREFNRQPSRCEAIGIQHPWPRSTLSMKLSMIYEMSSLPFKKGEIEVAIWPRMFVLLSGIFGPGWFHTRRPWAGCRALNGSGCRISGVFMCLKAYSSQ